jgi:O-antigen/teichoic acid export membrane protein
MATTNGIAAPGILRGFATLGTGTLLATVFNVLLTFVVPRIVSIADYGYWRIFLLYVGYAGLLHLGMSDGALISWSGRPLEDFGHEIRPTFRFLVFQHIAVIPVAALVTVVLGRPQIAFIGVAVLAFTLLTNAITLLQFGLQSARHFSPVAVSMAGPLGIFLVLVFFWELKRVPDFRVLILLYFAAWLSALVYLLATLRRQLRERSRQSSWSVGKGFLLLGWPVLLANIGLNVVQSVDRLMVSWATSIQDFAKYSFAATSTMTVVLALVSAMFRVFFPHVASLERRQHRGVYAPASRLLFLCWSLFLPYYFVLDTFVRHVLPLYSGSLPIADVLLIGTIFLGAVTILHASFFYLYRRQREFLWSTIGAIVLSFLIAGAAILGTHSLRVVAVGEVATLALWWAFNEWLLRDITGQTSKEWSLAAGLFCWAVISFAVAFREAETPLARTLIYYVMVGGVLWLARPTELSLGIRSLGRRPVNLQFAGRTDANETAT